MWSSKLNKKKVAALELPFQGNGLPAVMNAVLSADPPRLPRGAATREAADGGVVTAYSTELQQMVDGLLNKDPAHRPSADEAFSIATCLMLPGERVI
jgi:hypothetical protein